LLLLKTTGSPNKVIELLGYPSNPMLYHWKDKYPEYYDTPIQKQSTLSPKKPIVHSNRGCHYRWSEWIEIIKSAGLTEFIKEIDAYMHCTCKDRIKTTLGGISPLEYRKRIGVAV